MIENVKRPLLTSLLLLTAATTALALDPINETWRGTAIQGYDPVAYFTIGRPVEGKAEFSYEWRGARWLFSKREHLEQFQATPEKYAPQYGGYCAKAVSENTTADIDPAAWKIVDGKLYLNYSPKIQALWEADIPGRIARADAAWPKLLAD